MVVLPTTSSIVEIDSLNTPHASTTDRYSLEQISQRLKELDEHELQSPQTQARRRSRSEIRCTYLHTKPTWYRKPLCNTKEYSITQGLESYSTTTNTFARSYSEGSTTFLKQHLETG